MNIDSFVKKLEKLCNIDQTPSTIIISCPFSDHATLPKGRAASMMIGKRTKMGRCNSCGKEADLKEIIDVLEKIVSERPTESVSDEKPQHRVIKVDSVEREINFSEWRETIRDNFPDLVFPAEVGLSIIAQILIKDISNPFSVVLVDVPSSGKTITINFFQDAEGLTYASDKFTPASFVSNATNVKKKDLPKIDLLPRLQYRMFLLRDLATLFSKRDDDLAECLGLLTRVLDGEGLNTDSGVHGQRQYVGEYLFMILAGSTPIQPRVWNMMGSLGSRLFFLNMHSREKTEDELAEQLTTTAYKDKEKICRLATKHYLQNLWHDHQDGIVWDKAADRKEHKLIISRCAKLLAKLRGVIQVWKEKSSLDEEYEHTVPIVEQPDRINQLFYNGCRGHAVACGRTQLEEGDLKMIIELAIDSAPTMRARLFRELLEKGGEIGTADVMAAFRCSRPTALKEMEKLIVLEVCSLGENAEALVGGQEKTIVLCNAFQWFLSDECKRIRGISGPMSEPTVSNFV
jgi:hypothetical protein